MKSLFGVSGVSGARMARTLALAATLASTLLLAAGCGGGQSDGATGAGEEVVVASNVAYPPFEFSQGGQPTGFDIDLINEIADRAGFEVDLQNVRFDGIVQGLASGQYDAAISAMTITPERQEQVDFSEPYFNADQSLLVQADSEIGSTDGLGEATVGVESGTTGALEAQELEEAGNVGTVRTFNNVTDAFNALENGQVDAVINDFPVSQDRVQQSEGLEIVENIPTGEQYGIAFPQDSELVGPVNEALAEIKADGTYAEIYQKWFDRQPEQIP